MTPSKEMEKTRKVNKGPSAFERVKAKYGKSVMNVGKKKVKEELDLTQVAEALGGYIVEAPVDDDKKSGGKNKGGGASSGGGNQNTNQNKKKDRRPEDKARSDASAAQLSRAAALERQKQGADAEANPRKDVALDVDSYGRFDPASGTGMSDDDGTVAKGGKVTTSKIGDKQKEGIVARTRRLKAQADKKQRISTALQGRKDMEGGERRNINPRKQGTPVETETQPVTGSGSRKQKEDDITTELMRKGLL